MAVIPDLTEYNLIHCAICGIVDGGIDFEQVCIVNRIGDQRQFLIAVAHDDDDGEPHFHIELATEDWFDGSPPKRSGTRKSFDQIVERNKGKTCDVMVWGKFRVPYASLPQNGFVATAAKSRSAGTASMRLTGADFEISGTPFRRLRWMLIDDDPEDGDISVDIFLRGRTKGVLSDTYLVESVDFLRSGINTFVLGGKSCLKTDAKIILFRRNRPTSSLYGKNIGPLKRPVRTGRNNGSQQK